MAASQSVLEILIQAVDQSAAALQGAQNNLKEVADSAISTGVQIGIMGAALTAAYGGVVDAAANVQESQDNLKQAVTDAMEGASDSSSAYATQVQFLKDKIDGYKASIAQATATLDTNTGSTEKSAASHAKAAADIATDQANIEKYQQQLDILTNSESLNGQATEDIIAKLESQADANVSLGFSMSDSTRSLSQAFTATKSMSEALQVNQAAMDLARAKNLDLATATNQVILAMNGQGRALATYGIQIKDGLSGMSALEAVQGAVNGQAQAYADTLTGQLAVAMQSFNKLLSDMGTTQMPLLTQLLQAIVKIVDAVDSWTQKHQKLTETILLFVGVLGGLLVLAGAVLVAFGTITLAVLALSAPVAGLIVVIAALAAIIIANWTTIATTVAQIWDGQMKLFESDWDKIKTLFSSALNFVESMWNNAWQGMSDFLSTIWSTISNTVKTGFNDIISAINGFINALDAIHISIPSISIPGTKLATPSLNLGFSIPNIPMLAAGGFVTQPTLALIGEAGPEAVVPLSRMGPNGAGFGGSSIVININGGNYLDQGGAKMIGDALAKQIGQQLKLRNYAL